VSYSVSQRTKELGIRVALGANRRDILGLIMGENCRLALLGCTLGCSMAFVVGRLAMSQVSPGQVVFGAGIGFEPVPKDAPHPAAFIVSSLFLFCVAISACYVPARRALRVDPLVALQ
jgi:ABC-type antimicrobial peptide transport system permease subunit